MTRLGIECASPRPRRLSRLAFALVLVALVAAGFYAGCRCGLRPLVRCETDSAELARLSYQAVQAEAAKRGRCVLVCYADIERRICPVLDSGADS